MNTTAKTSLLGLLLVIATQAQADVSANLGFASEYYYRGIFQESTSANGGLDYESGGFYAGTWAADVGDGLDEGMGRTVELDVLVHYQRIELLPRGTQATLACRHAADADQIFQIEAPLLQNSVLAAQHRTDRAQAFQPLLEQPLLRGGLLLLGAVGLSVAKYMSLFK